MGIEASIVVYLALVQYMWEVFDTGLKASSWAPGDRPHIYLQACKVALPLKPCVLANTHVDVTQEPMGKVCMLENPSSPCVNGVIDCLDCLRS